MREAKNDSRARCLSEKIKIKRRIVISGFSLVISRVTGTTYGVQRYSQDSRLRHPYIFISLQAGIFSRIGPDPSPSAVIGR
jgi:hypothetical protein